MQWGSRARRPSAESNPQFPAGGRVHAEQPHCGPTCWRQPSHDAAHNHEMLGPNLSARVEEVRDLVCLIIDCAEVRSLVMIAVMASQREVRRIIRTVMLAGNDVLDVKTKIRFGVLMKPAILALIAGTLPNELARGEVHQAAA